MFKVITDIFIVLVAIEALGIMLFEMFGNQTRAASKAFAVNKKVLKQKEVQVMMQNQGLYNGFLGVGILISKYGLQSNSAVLMFIIFVVIAAIFGALTANKRILLTQGIPAIIALILMILN